LKAKIARVSMEVDNEGEQINLILRLLEDFTKETWLLLDPMALDGYVAHVITRKFVLGHWIEAEDGCCNTNIPAII